MNTCITCPHQPQRAVQGFATAVGNRFDFMPPQPSKPEPCREEGDDLAPLEMLADVRCGSFTA